MPTIVMFLAKYGGVALYKVVIIAAGTVGGIFAGGYFLGRSRK